MRGFAAVINLIGDKYDGYLKTLKLGFLSSIWGVQLHRREKITVRRDVL
jgi:hypothetical protein